MMSGRMMYLQGKHLCDEILFGNFNASMKSEPQQKMLK